MKNSDFVFTQFNNVDDFASNVLQDLSKRFVWEATLESSPADKNKSAGATPVAMARINEATKDCLKLGGVYTPPAYRNSGFASALCFNICKQMLKQYPDIMLYAKVDNEISNKCYQNIGFKKHCIVTQYLFKPVC